PRPQRCRMTASGSPRCSPCSTCLRATPWSPPSPPRSSACPAPDPARARRVLNSLEPLCSRSGTERPKTFRSSRRHIAWPRPRVVPRMPRGPLTAGHGCVQVEEASQEVARFAKVVVGGAHHARAHLVEHVVLPSVGAVPLLVRAVPEPVVLDRDPQAWVGQVDPESFPGSRCPDREVDLRFGESRAQEGEAGLGLLG